MSDQKSKKSQSQDGVPPRTPRGSGSVLSARALLSRQLGSTSAPSPGRLPSLRPARDLTLGATPKLTLGGAPKRTFTPNIPTRRIKEEPKDVPAKEQSERPRTDGRGRGHSRRGKESGRGRGNRGKPEIVSSASVFSMGPAEKLKAGQVLSTTGFAGGSKGGEKRSQITGKTERKGEAYDDEESKRILKMLNAGNDVGDEEGQEFGMAPVQIPLSQYRQQLAESNTAGLTAQIKDEPMDLDEDENDTKKPIKHVPIPTTVKTDAPEISCSTLFSSEPEEGQEKFLFFQFPDKLPIRPGDENEPMSTDQSEAADNNKKSKEDKKVSLKDVSEGYIGKLQILKSGKTRLVLGDVILEVAMGTSCSFLQDLVSVHTDEQRADMTVLGHLRHRLICTPDYERLLAS